MFQFNRLKWDEKIIPLERKIAEKKYVQDIENIHLTAVNLYFDVLLAQENLEIASKNRDINKKLLEIAEERFNLGKISENEQLQLSLELQNATRDYSRANYELQSAVSDLEVFLKNDVQVKNAAVVIPEPLPLLDISLETAIIRARNNRSEFLQFTRDLLDAEKETDRVSKLYGFQAELYASFGYARGSQNLSDIYSDPITEQQVTLSLSIPLIDWGRKKEATKIAQAQYDFVQKRNEQDLIDFDNYVSQTVYFFMQLQTEVSAQKQIVGLTEKRYEISRQRYILGDISTTDLSISQREKDQARRNYVSALRDYWSTYYLLRQLTSYDFVENENITYKINL